MWDLIVSVPDHCLSFYFSTVNVDKTKVVIFRASWQKPNVHVVFLYNNEEIEIVDSFSYLDLLMHLNLEI